MYRSIRLAASDENMFVERWRKTLVRARAVVCTPCFFLIEWLHGVSFNKASVASYTSSPPSVGGSYGFPTVPFLCTCMLLRQRPAVMVLVPYHGPLVRRGQDLRSTLAILGSWSDTALVHCPSSKIHSIIV